MHSRSVAALVAVAALAVALTAIAIAGVLLPGEVALAQHVQKTPAGGPLEALSDALATRYVEGAVLVAGALLALRGRDYALVLAALFALAATALNPAIKEIAQRARPTDADLVIREPAPGYGFPSGHVMGATLIYGYAIVAAWRHAPRPAHAFAIAAALLAIGIIAWDRVYNGAHWPSDVLGGGTIGVLLLAAAVALPLLPRLTRPREQRNEQADGAERRTA